MQSGDLDLGVIADSHEAAVTQAIDDFSEHAGDRPLALGTLTSVGHATPTGRRRDLRWMSTLVVLKKLGRLADEP